MLPEIPGSRQLVRSIIREKREMEILAPAGDWDKLRYAVAYGADAVYTAGKQFGLRAKAGNLSPEELKKGVTFCHDHNCKIYVAVNIFAHNSDIPELYPYVEFLREIEVDALIVSDPGVVKIVKEVAPQLPIHLSTQANTTSWKAAEFWAEQGVSRIILARELTFGEITGMIQAVPGIEFEMFIHGAMCISYSGRCLLSAYLNNRSANRGLCTQPCRWKMHLMEETRPGQYFPIEEDERGVYILNSKDLCLYEQLAEIQASGLTSLKIEGRMKSLYYVANTTRVYKTALEYWKRGETPPLVLKEELDKISHRHYTEGFFSEKRREDTQYYETASYLRNYQYLGEVVGSPEESARDSSGFLSLINIKAKFSRGEQIEIIYPDYRADQIITVDEIYSLEDERLIETKPNSVVKLVTKRALSGFGILRKRL